MQIYNIREARTHLSKLIEKAAKGESFLIAKSGKPMVKVIPLDAPEPSQIQRFGFMSGQLKVPDDFNTEVPYVFRLPSGRPHAAVSC